VRAGAQKSEVHGILIGERYRRVAKR